MEIIKFLAVKLDKEEYGINLKAVQSIEQLIPITRVPNVEGYIKGVINLRGNVTPVIDLRLRLGHTSVVSTEETRIIITKQDDIELGWIVDETTDVFEVASMEIESASANGLDSPFFEGIANLSGRLIILLNIDKLMDKSIES